MENIMQQRQNAVMCEILVQGLADWKEALAKIVKCEYPWSHLLRAFEAPLIDIARKSVEINDESFERAALEILLGEGYQFEELECEFTGKPEWGKGIWYREHSAYVPVPKSKRLPSYYHAIFQTENAGDQHFNIYSTQCGGLLRKALIYRKVVLSQPKQESANETKVA